MENKLKICVSCNKPSFIWKTVGKDEKYCKYCWLKKQRTFIKPKSNKRISLDTLYSIMRKDFLELHPTCQIKLPDCTLISTDIHHMAGRGKNYLNNDTWLSTCRTCHKWVEENPKLAKELGFSKNRLDN